MTPPAPWTPTAHAFAQHQFSHVANFWKQGRQASFRLEALPSGQAELNLTFHLPAASEVIPEVIPRCTQFLSAPYSPFSLKAASLKSLMLTPNNLPRFLRGGGAKITSAQYSTQLPRPCLLFLPLKVGHYARLLKSAFNACRLLQPFKNTLKVKESAPYLPLQATPPPQTSHLCHKG